MPRYKRAKRSHVLFTRRWHLYLYRKQPVSRGVGSGVSMKRRRKDGLWRHVQLRSMRYTTLEKGCHLIHHYELSWHLSTKAQSSESRIRRSKRYFRFKVCL